jgi:uncharacterized membrane protein YcaP (DUF421 family)
MAGVFRAIFGYCFLVFMVRIAGRRPGKQITPFEFLMVFFMGGMTLTSMVADDRSLINAALQILSVALAHYGITALKLKSPRFGRIVDGTPLVLFEHGRWHTESMKGMRLNDQDVLAIVRDQGLERLDQIDYAILERNGEISIVPSENRQ